MRWIIVLLFSLSIFSHPSTDSLDEWDDTGDPVEKPQPKSQPDTTVTEEQEDVQTSPHSPVTTPIHSVPPQPNLWTRSEIIPIYVLVLGVCCGMFLKARR